VTVRALHENGRQFEKELPRGLEAPWVARRSLADWLGAVLGRDELHTVKLLASELVTNAVLHGRGTILLRAQLDEDRVLVDVTDEGEEFHHEVRRQEFEQLHGRGLAIVDAEASSWGIDEGTTRVWFELEHPRYSPN
jgi:anti-sigma regulatory factor (Ser/Thr protein kinase)